MSEQEKAVRFRALAAELRRELAGTKDKHVADALAELARQYDALVPLHKTVLPDLFQVQVWAPVGVRRDPAVMCARNGNNAQSQVFCMVRPPLAHSRSAR